MDHDDDDDFDLGPSKSELKRQSHDLQKLGEALIELPQHEFDALSLPDKLRDAVLLARRITAHGGLYRQKQYIGKLMRSVDAEPIRRALAARAAAHRAEAMRLKQVEAWRARLLAEGAPALDALIEAHPRIDRASVSRLMEQARAERDRARPPRAARELFGVIRDGLLAG